MRRISVLQPIQSIEEVQASLDTFGGRIADRMDGRRSSPPDGGAEEPTFSYREVFDDLGRDLESLRRKVVAAEDEHVRRLAGAAAARRRSRELGDELRDLQVMARRILGGAYPGQGFELAAVSGDTPRNYKPLEEQVDLTVKLLREPVVELPEIRLRGVDITPGEVAKGLDSSLGDLREARKGYGRARKAAGESKVDLDRTIDEFKATFPWIAQALEAFARLAGERELADRIRTSIRRVTRRKGEEDGSSEQTPSEDASSSEEAAASSEAASEEASSTEASSSETSSTEASETSSASTES